MPGAKQASDEFLIQGADVVSRGLVRRRTSVLVVRGRVRAVGGAADRAGRRHQVRRLDAGGMYLTPGLVDLHTHGAVGVDFVEATRDEFARATQHYLSRGVTSFLVSLYPSEFSRSLQVLERIAGYLREGVGGGAAIGIHLEGPYLNPRKPGALPGSVFRTFKASEAARLLKAGGGFVRTMTLAPEIPGGRKLLHFLQRHGVVPAFGHSDAGYEATRGALKEGIRYATHLFNAMQGIHHRDPGAVTALLEDPRVAVELIADGFHVDVPVLRLVHAIKPRQKIVLVSDSVHPCGLKAGRYEFAGRPVLAAGKRVTLLDGTLAGSLLTLDHAVRLQVERVGLELAAAIQCASENPARVIGRERVCGSIVPGRRADLLLLDKKLRVRATWLAGNLVHGRVG